MIVELLNISKLEQLFLEIFINKTDKVTDISDLSVTSATAFGVAKVAQKAIKDIALVESNIMPDSAIEDGLDNAAVLFGVPERKSATTSGTWIRVSADVGTSYTKDVNYFTNYNGIRFEIEETFEVGSLGYGYLRVKSIDVGDKANVDQNTIISVSPEPTGHISCTNEYKAIGGYDEETDDVFRKRIKSHHNIVSVNTLAYFLEIFREVNDDILKVYHLGIDDDGKRTLGLVTVNGVSLESTELDDILDQTKDKFSLSDLDSFGEVLGVKLDNVSWYEFDMDFRVEITDNYDSDEVRKNIQTAISKYVNFVDWPLAGKIEWDELLQIVKDIDGVKYVPDKYFYPQVDLQTPVKKLPRLKGFKMRDLDGTIISDSLDVLTPIFYQNEADPFN